MGKIGVALSMEAIVASFVVAVLTCLAARQFIKSRMKDDGIVTEIEIYKR